MGIPATRAYPGRRWPFVLAFVTGFLLIAMQQLSFGLLDVRGDAEEDARAILSFLEARDEPIDDARLAHVSARFTRVLASNYCDPSACLAHWQRVEQGRTACSEGWWHQALCPAASAESTAGHRLSVRYSVVETIVSNVRDLGFFALFGVIAFVVWATASRQYRQQIDEAGRRLRHAASHDGLTGLANRSAFEAAVDAQLKRSPSVPGTAALLFLDLEGFDDINDTYGHAAGDALIAEVARRFATAASPRCLVSRLGGDEFGVLVHAGPDAGAPDEVASRLHQALQAPVNVNGVTTPVGARIGIASLDTTVPDSNEALRRADVALHHVKKMPGTRTRHFDLALDRQARARYALERDLAEAVAAGSLHLEYQPQLDLEDQLRGVEALARWHHPTLGPVSPAEFIPLAENSDLIVALGKLVIRTACTDLNRAREQGLHLPYVSVNVSPRQLVEPDFCGYVEQELARHHLGPRDMELEVTESALMGGTGLAAIEQFARRGFRIAIDDFGTGYSSLSRLQSMPVDKLKIDRSFVMSLDSRTESPVVIETILALAKRLGLRTVAEGVDDIAQVAWLQQAGCDLMQGFLFARPMTMANLVHWWAERRRTAAEALTWQNTDAHAFEFA